MPRSRPRTSENVVLIRIVATGCQDHVDRDDPLLGRAVEAGIVELVEAGE